MWNIWGVGSALGLVAGGKWLATSARSRGADSSGLVFATYDAYQVHRADFDIQYLKEKINLPSTSVIAGHSRLVTNGHFDNQPVIRDGIIVLHYGIVVNSAALWDEIGAVPEPKIDTEIIPGIARHEINTYGDLNSIAERVFECCGGAVNCAMLIPGEGKLPLFTNNGSLYTGVKNGNGFSPQSRSRLQKLVVKKSLRSVTP